jgi:hypothetical protein
MVAKDSSIDHLLGELTDAAYASALRHQSRWQGTSGEYESQHSFLDLELEIWKSLRRVLERKFVAPNNATVEPNDDISPAASKAARKLSTEVARELSEAGIALAGWQS